MVVVTSSKVNSARQRSGDQSALGCCISHLRRAGMHHTLLLLLLAAAVEACAVVAAGVKGLAGDREHVDRPQDPMFSLLKLRDITVCLSTGCIPCRVKDSAEGYAAAVVPREATLKLQAAVG